jgi:peptidyl-prolyl cis-trans isomerase B (cyclophilin B)
VSSRKQQHDYARRRYEKWLAHQDELRARQRRRRIVVGWVLGVLGVAGCVWLVVSLARGDDTSPVAEPSASTTTDTTPSATASPTETPAETPAATPTPTEPAAAIPDPSVAEGRMWTATLSTTAGPITLELDGDAAPQAVASFVTLAKDGFYDGTTCNRLTTSGFFLLECGDPTGTGTGGPAYRFGPIENSPADNVYPAGTVVMARDAGDAAGIGSRFYLIYQDTTIQPDSAGGYTVLGHITGGREVLDAVAAAGVVEGTAVTPVTQVTIEGVEIE